ncbi:DUF4189 domain-containing protein [Xanthomonas graminis]|uniref:DUF4189 domain-containing protein n=1 Tax=Xanthomonas graminis TaxID=3390026 RepID=UPI0009B9E34F|nr:DUF4189 domain-containing protein [Xanthomonas translucens]UKE67146.1 DUF4189 domain-containing protein [Xanthomonas translucens pv. phlei]
MKIIFFIVLSLTLASVAQSQTRCPTGVQAGSAQCLPDDEGSAPPRPTGEWIKTWGAIANADNTNEAWASVKMLSKKDAEDDALDQCRSAGYKGCVVTFTYRNQCVAIASPNNGRTQGGVAGRADLALAKTAAVEICEKNGGSGCSVIYSDCTDPVFKKF